MFELLPRVLRIVKFNQHFKKKWKKKERIKNIYDYPETRWGYIYMCVCQGHLREKNRQAV